MGGARAPQPPHVSVIVATFNRSELLVEAIGSALRQSFPALEIIVCDDGSTDDTPARVRELDGPTRYVRVPHSGVPARVRNQALRHARGEYVAFLDDDDVWEPEKLARQIAVVEADAEVGVVWTGFSILDRCGVHVPELEPWQTAPGPLLDRLLRGCFIHPSSAVVRRDLLEHVGGFDERRPLCEDFDLFLRLAPLTRGVCIADPLVRLRHGWGASASADERLVYRVSISILEDQLAGRGLDRRQRFECRRGLSNLHVKAAGVARGSGDAAAERRHIAHALRRDPTNPLAWRALGRAVMPRRP